MDFQQAALLLQGSVPLTSGVKVTLGTHKMKSTAEAHCSQKQAVGVWLKATVIARHGCKLEHEQGWLARLRTQGEGL